MCDKPLALEGKTTSATFAEHINALHSARRAYISAESSERVRRALRYKIRTYSEHFELGDKVYYKREDSQRWHGPGKVIGQDGKIILIRHGGTYKRVSSNRVIRVNEEFNMADQHK